MLWTRKTSTSFTKLITCSLTDSQIRYLKAVHLYLSLQLIWTRMVWSIPYKVRKPILMGNSQCVGYKTLALFVYHPAMQHILRLATMEVKNESTHEITVFWDLFNEILSDIKSRDYKFNLKAIMVDENGANYCAIQKVFGLDFVTSKVVSCQMHYKNDVNRVSFRISESYRDLFRSICHEMCSTATVARVQQEYETAG